VRAGNWPRQARGELLEIARQRSENRPRDGETHIRNETEQGIEIVPILQLIEPLRGESLLGGSFGGKQRGQRHQRQIASGDRRSDLDQHMRYQPQFPPGECDLAIRVIDVDSELTRLLRDLPFAPQQIGIDLVDPRLRRFNLRIMDEERGDILRQRRRDRGGCPRSAE
jgi:hypothetical protein